MTMDSLALVSDGTAADAIVAKVKDTSTMMGDHTDTFASLVRWLRTASPDAEPVALVYPEAPFNLIRYHEGALDRLRLWADNGIDDVKDGVDAQAVHLTGMAQGGDLWPTDSCATDADAKDFLGGVMRYKTAKNAGAVSIDEVAVPPVGEPIIAVEEPVKSEADLLREQLEEALQARRTAHRAHERDIEIIGEVLMEEARSRSWCSEYDQIVDGLNGRLNISLPIREQDYDVTVTGWMRVPFSYTVIVTAQDEDSACEYAQEMDLPFDADDAFRNASARDAEFEDESGFEYEASEA
jgi:hypothetical protein